MTTRWCELIAPALVGGPARSGILALIAVPVAVPGRGTVPGGVRLLIAGRTAVPDQAAAALALITAIADPAPALAVTDKPGVVAVRDIAALATACAASAAPT